MNFECKKISIDEEEFGCTITFSENADQNEFDKGQTVEEIMNSIGRYIMLQRTYSEDEFEKDYYYFESSDFEKSGELNDFEISLSRTQLVLIFENEMYEIQISPSNQKFEEIKDAIKKLAEEKGKINIL
jgi:hypothetical protein